MPAAADRTLLACVRTPHTAFFFPLIPADLICLVPLSRTARFFHAISGKLLAGPAVQCGGARRNDPGCLPLLWPQARLVSYR